MTTFWRRAHTRTNALGTTFDVSGCDVCRTNWDVNQQQQEDSRFENYKQSFSFPTFCPECQQPVFFYSNIHGSKVFFDYPLESPWYKHPCTDKSNNKKDNLSVKNIPSIPFSPEYGGVPLYFLSYTPQTKNPEYKERVHFRTLGESERVIEIYFTQREDVSWRESIILGKKDEHSNIWNLSIFDTLKMKERELQGIEKKPDQLEPSLSDSNQDTKVKITTTPSRISKGAKALRAVKSKRKSKRLQEKIFRNTIIKQCKEIGSSAFDISELPEWLQTEIHSCGGFEKWLIRHKR